MFGYVPSEVLGKNVKMPMPEEFASKHDDFLEQYRRTGRRAIIGVGRVVPIQKRDGQIENVELSISELKLMNSNQVYYTGVMRHITSDV